MSGQGVASLQIHYRENDQIYTLDKKDTPVNIVRLSLNSSAFGFACVYLQRYLGKLGKRKDVNVV